MMGAGEPVPLPYGFSAFDGIELDAKGNIYVSEIYVSIELDARLALAEIEMKLGQMTAGRAHLAAIEIDAKTKGYILIAREAATARG